MSNPNWKAIWDAKRETEAPTHDDDALLSELLTLNGYRTQVASVATATWRTYVVELALSHGLRPNDRVYEVGCGAGAFLQPLSRLCGATDGIDYSASLVAAAQRHLPNGRFTVGDAREVDPSERYDIVLSSGVFIYFGDEAYAREVLEKMIAKCIRGVWILDVNDADQKDAALAIRRATCPPGEYDKTYAGLQHLFLAKSWFREVAAARDLECCIEPQTLPGYVNSGHRYHVFLARPGTSPAAPISA